MGKEVSSLRLSMYKTLVCFSAPHKSCTVVHASNPSPRELESGGQKFKVILGSKFQTGRGYMKL